MERVYTVVVSGVASPAAAFDLFEVTAAAAKPLQLTRIEIGQTSEPTTEEEMLAISIIRGYTVSGSGGSTTTPVPLDGNDAASGATCKTMNTTLANTGTPLIAYEGVVNIRAGGSIPFAPDEGPRLIGSERGVVRISAPADAITFRATLWFKEMF